MTRAQKSHVLQPAIQTRPEPPPLPTKWENFEAAVGEMANIKQWHLFRLEWSTAKGKFEKRPCFMDGSRTAMDANDPANWNDFRSVLDTVRALDTPRVGGSLRYAVGFRLTEEAEYFLLDMDKCRTSDHLSPLAQSLIKRFPGAMVEISSTGNGMHVIGRCKHLPHSKQNKANNIELYTAGQSIAFGIDYACGGCTNARWDAEVNALVADYFPASEVPVGGSLLPVVSTGFTDEQIIAKAHSGSSHLRRLSGKPTFTEIFDGLAPLDSEHDMALASMLAFWTGRDADQIERVMRKSKRVRDKWNTRRGKVTWLQYTIAKACGQCKKTYGVDRRNQKTELGSPTTASLPATNAFGGPGHSVVPTKAAEILCDVQRVDELVRCIRSAENEVQLLEDVVLRIRDCEVPVLLQAKVADAFKAALKTFGNNAAISQVRTLLFKGTHESASAPEIPAWARDYVFVNDGDYFFNPRTGSKKTHTGFRANYSRHMPCGEFGRHGDAAEASLTTYGMTTVDRVGYKPDEGIIYKWEGATYANLYSPESVPALAAAYTEVGLEGIRAFHAHLFDMCGRRLEVFAPLLSWFAHNVQYPGKKYAGRLF